MIPLLVVLPVTVERNREEMCELRHASLLVQKMQGRAEVSRLADAKAASREGGDLGRSLAYATVPISHRHSGVALSE